MEFLIRNFDSTNTDPDRDREGCRKRGMCDAEMPDGHEWGRLERLPRFVIIKCPEIVDKSELGQPEGLSKKWADDFDYEIVASRPAQGEYDIRIFEKNPGAINQNAIAGVKATRIRDYLQAWGCSNFSLTATDASFTFSLWDAVRSANFWNVSVLQLAQMNFALDSYTGGVGTITVTLPTETEPEAINKLVAQATRKITERGGIITLTAYPAITFTGDSSGILTRFKADVKRRTQRIYMYQQHRLSTAIMDQAEDNGGVLTLTKAELISAIRNMAAE